VTPRIRGIFFVFLTVLLLLPCLPAQTTPQLTPFSADMQFTSSRMGGSTPQTMTGKMYVGHGNMRMDLTGGPRGSAVMITNFASKTTDTLLPEQHMYMEFKADQLMARHGMGPNISPIPDPNNPCANEQGATCKNLGVEQVNGRSCTHWQITDKNGKVGNVWIDQQLHFPIKATDADSKWELSNIKEGEPAASLFQVPSGYQKMDLGGMMQGARPPQQ